jgi:hypothetical protein
MMLVRPRSSTILTRRSFTGPVPTMRITMSRRLRSLFSDVCFVNAQSLDLRLQSDSPARDQRTTLWG